MHLPLQKSRWINPESAFYVLGLFPPSQQETGRRAARTHTHTHTNVGRSKALGLGRRCLGFSTGVSAVEAERRLRWDLASHALLKQLWEANEAQEPALLICSTSPSAPLDTLLVRRRNEGCAPVLTAACVPGSEPGPVRSILKRRRRLLL